MLLTIRAFRYNIENMSKNKMKGNRFWEARATHGREKIFSTPDLLWTSAVEYFNWVEDHPLEEQKLFAYQGEVSKDTVYKMRAMTMDGLYLFLGIGSSTWTDYKNREEFSEVVSNIEKTIREQKFTGAAADLLNANIIARDLGLKDATTSEVKTTSTDKAEELSDDTLIAIIEGRKK